MGLAFNGLALFGAISMLSLKRWGFCIAGAIALIVPCSGCCCCLGLISGIWALVVLNKTEVRSAFTS